MFDDLKKEDLNSNVILKNIISKNLILDYDKTKIENKINKVEKKDLQFYKE